MPFTKVLRKISIFEQCMRKKVQRSPNSILLEWSKPEREERNGIIRGYWLQYYPRTLWYGT